MSDYKLKVVAVFICFAAFLLAITHEFVPPSHLPYLVEIAAKNTEGILTVTLGVITIIIGLTMFHGSEKPEKPTVPNAPIERSISESDLEAFLKERTLKFSTDKLMHGPDVILLQEALTKAGHPTPVTGKFDLATKQSVEAFQERKNLPADGIAGPTTKMKLGMLKKGSEKPPSNI